MMGLTHAIGGASTVLLANYLNPDFFPLSIWLIIMSFYVSQGPDIDIKKSHIKKNVWLKPITVPLGFLISGHRAKETHSLFGTAFYGLISLPLIMFFGFGFWAALVLAYFSHIFLDYFNPTGVKLFYIPLFNTEPRSWSLYNTIPQLIVEIPYLLGKLVGSKRKRKQIKFDGVGVMTGGTFENIISISLWILFVTLLIINFKELKLIILSESTILTSFSIISAFIIFNLYIVNRKLIVNYKKHFKISFGLGALYLISLYFQNKYNLKDANAFILIILFTGFSLFPLLYLLLLNFYENVKSLPGKLFHGGATHGKDYSDYKILTHLLLLFLLFFSFNHIDLYIKESNNFIKEYQQEDNKKEWLQNKINNLKESYELSVKELKKKTNIIVEENKK